MLQRERSIFYGFNCTLEATSVRAPETLNNGPRTEANTLFDISVKGMTELLSDRIVGVEVRTSICVTLLPE